MNTSFGCCCETPAYAGKAERLQKRLARLEKRSWGKWRNRRIAKIKAKLASLQTQATAQGLSLPLSQLTAQAEQSVAMEEGYLPPPDIQAAAAGTGGLPGGPIPWIVGGLTVLGAIGLIATAPGGKKR